MDGDYSRFSGRTVAAGYLATFYKGALAAGVEQSALDEIIGGDPASLTIPTRRFPAAGLLRLLDLAVAQTGKRTIGIDFGLNLRPGPRIDVIYATTFCHNLREAIELNSAYQPLIQQIGRTRLVVDDRGARLIWTPFWDAPELMRLFTEVAFTGYASIGKWMVWADEPPVRVMRFRHAAPPDLSPYHEVFGENVEFGADIDEMIFPRGVLETRLTGRNPEMVSRMRARLDAMLQVLDQPGDVIRDVRAIIATRLTHGPVKIDTICTQLNVSERTLRRHLNQADTSFGEILTEVRRDLAQIFMNDQNMSLVQISDALGFSDQSAFSRAFKNWFDQSPLAYRQALSA
ncbi:MAG: AraC family transcriptional regulator [Hellea sp.]|nr:AraC family transcriptional regulator [Hellea sp.]